MPEDFLILIVIAFLLIFFCTQKRTLEFRIFWIWIFFIAKIRSAFKKKKPLGVGQHQSQLLDGPAWREDHARLHQAETIGNMS